MKAVKTLILITFIAVLVVGIAVAQQEQERPARTRGTGTGVGMRMGMSPTRMVLMFGQQLNLTDEQRTKLEGYEPKDPNALRDAQMELSNVQRELNAAVMAVDETKIKELCKKVGPATEKLSLLQAQDYKFVKGVLNPEQFQQLQENMTRPRTPTGGAGGPGGPGGPGTGNRPRGTGGGPGGVQPN